MEISERDGREVVRSLPIARLDLTTAAECRDDDQADQVKEIIARYAEAMDDGKYFPPIDVFDDGAVLRVADGKKRVLAAERIGKRDIRATVHAGGLREAILHAAGANLTHGVVSSRADKRRAVEAVLRVAPDLSDREIGRQCGVSPTTVGDARRGLSVQFGQIDGPQELSGEIPQIDATRTVHRNGTTYTQDTSRIGAKPSANADVEDVIQAARERGTIPANAVVRVTETEGEEAAPAEPITDADWLDQFSIRAQLSPIPLKTFDVSALGYRAIEAARIEFTESFLRPAIKRAEAVIKDAGPYLGMLAWAMRLPHPSQWTLCKSCNGSGELQKSKGQCPDCERNGFTV